jgi:multidrug efflux system membrane fusion protein
VYRPVKLGPLVDGLRVVREGLKADERVVILGLMSVRNGNQVKPALADMALTATTKDKQP